jgi:hypothetical protein
VTTGASGVLPTNQGTSTPTTTRRQLEPLQAITPGPAQAITSSLINPWEYRHLRVFGVTRIAGGSVAAAAGIVCLSYGVYGWAAFFLVIGALNLAGGYWYLAIARSASARH